LPANSWNCNPHQSGLERAPVSATSRDQQHLKESPMAPLVDSREKAEKGLSSLSTPGDRFAYWLSQITSPFVVGLGVLGYVSLSLLPQR